MMEQLEGFEGKSVIVDYKTSGSMNGYAKGMLSIKEGRIVVENEEKIWFIDPEVVLVVRVGE